MLCDVGELLKNVGSIVARHSMADSFFWAAVERCLLVFILSADGAWA